VLERLTSLDLALDRFLDGSIAQGEFIKIHGLALRRDTHGLPGYDLFLERDLATYFWTIVCELGHPLGLRPVGRAVEDELS
jgi:hypothetical protein